MPDFTTLINLALPTCLEAGKAILSIYKSDVVISYKQDKSPLTEADQKAHTIIEKALEGIGYPILSEEGIHLPYEQRKDWETFWLIDPLDGTKEFLKENGNFTVNIALIDKGKPVMGLIYAPVSDMLYIGWVGKGSYRIKEASVACRDCKDDRWLLIAEPLPFQNKHESIGIVASSSHLSSDTTEFINAFKRKHRNIRIVSKGSSLKLCLLAECEASIYPRFSPTSEWDIAAGHAILNAIGGKVLQYPELEKELVYNKEKLTNPFFLAVNSSESLELIDF